MDAVLREAAQRLQATIRGHDVVARIGGDEFCVLVTQARGKAELVGLSHRILDTIAEPLTVAGHEIEVGCSIGVSHFPHHGLLLDELIEAADEAMYKVKAGGEGDVSIAT